MKKRNNTQEEYIGLRLSTADKKFLKAKADKMGISMSAYIRIITRKHIEELKGEE